MTTWLRGRIEREEAWRTRLLEASDDAVTALARHANAAVACLAWARENADWVTSAEIVDRLARAAHADAEGAPVMNRLGLLFGTGSDVYTGATAAFNEARVVRMRLEEGRTNAEGAKTAVDEAIAAWETTLVAYRRFVNAASLAIRAPRRDPVIANALVFQATNPP